MVVLVSLYYQYSLRYSALNVRTFTPSRLHYFKGWSVLYENDTLRTASPRPFSIYISYTHTPYIKVRKIENLKIKIE